VGLRRVDSFEVSNVGVMDGSDDQSKVAKVKRILFSQSSNVIGPPYVFSVATAKGKGILLLGLLGRTVFWPLNRWRRFWLAWRLNHRV
jgi:hypothetical protein